MTMIHFKNNSAGFTLIEALIAMVIIGIAITPIIGLQLLLLRMVNDSGQQIRRILQAQTFLVHTQRTAIDKDTESVATKVERPATQLKFSLAPLHPDAVLKSNKHIQQERVNMQWQDNGRPRSDNLMTFLYVRKKA